MGQWASAGALHGRRPTPPASPPHAYAAVGGACGEKGHLHPRSRGNPGKAGLAALGAGLLLLAAVGQRGVAPPAAIVAAPRARQAPAVPQPEEEAPALFEAEPADAAPDLTEVRSARRAAHLAALEHERERDAYIADGAGGFRTDEVSLALLKRIRASGESAFFVPPPPFAAPR